MAHFAKLGVNGKVIAVHALDNSKLLNADNVEDESVGQQELERIHGWPTAMWIKTSYNTRGNKYYNADGTEGDQTKKLRGNYAGIGYTWDEDNEIFWPKKPHASWVKNTTTAAWDSPLGAAPALTAEQTSQNEAGTHRWSYSWDESAYQADNTAGWVISNTLA
jgi:hypothetical protein